MRDNQHLMTEFVKIVEKFPEIYDQNMDSYRTRFSEIAWSKVADLVRTELNEECTVEELKVKWKGVRSSFTRYKSKLYSNNPDIGPVKKYYLYDHLKFLDPFVRCKGSPSREDRSDSCFNDSNNYVNVDNMDGSEDFSVVEDWNHIELKPDSVEPTRSSNAQAAPQPSRKRKMYEDQEDTEDLQFFKSILPDIKYFTIREKRKLKMGILKLIDDLESERKDDEST